MWDLTTALDLMSPAEEGKFLYYIFYYVPLSTVICLAISQVDI